MAIYHFQAKSVSRSTGRSATAAAAYRSGSEIADQRTGDVYDYTRKQGVEHTEIVLPDYAARHDINWPRDRAALWNAAELAEKRRDSRVAREYEVALPAELTAEQRQDLAREFAQHIADRHGCAVDIAIHAPHRAGDARNHHAHLLATTRRITPEGLGDKTTVELSETDRKKRGLPLASEEMSAIRGRWAQMTNEALARHGHTARIDHRTLAAQREDALRAGDAERAEELNREPTKHLGVAATAMERRGERTDLGEFNRRIAEAAEAGRLERERQALEGSIVDVSGNLTAALKERDSARELQRQVQPDGPLALDARRQAREAWTALRSQAQEARNQAGLWRDALKGPDRTRESFARGENPGAGRAANPSAGPASLLERIGRQPADPQQMEQLLRETLEREARQQQQRTRDPNDRSQVRDRDPTRDPAPSRDGRGGRDPLDADRENTHQRDRSRDQGLDR